MQTSHQDAAHSLYVLYLALPEQSQQLFLKELLDQQAERLLHQPQPNQKGDRFADICGILTATRSVSLEEIEQVISQQGWDGFDRQ